MATSNDSTGTDYFDFVCEAMGEIYSAQAVLAGARSLIWEHCDVEGETALTQVRTLLAHVDKEFDALALRLDESSRRFELKKTAT